MKIKYEDYITERYNTLKANIFEFFEDLGIEVEIQIPDKQTMKLEFNSKIDKKPEWLDDFSKLTTGDGYDQIYIENNILMLSRSLGLFYIPNEYNSF